LFVDVKVLFKSLFSLSLKQSMKNRSSFIMTFWCELSRLSFYGALGTIPGAIETFAKKKSFAICMEFSGSLS
jgi:hypothetical protein